MDGSDNPDDTGARQATGFPLSPLTPSGVDARTSIMIEVNGPRSQRAQEQMEHWPRATQPTAHEPLCLTTRRVRGSGGSACCPWSAAASRVSSVVAMDVSLDTRPILEVVVGCLFFRWISLPYEVLGGLKTLCEQVRL